MNIFAISGLINAISISILGVFVYIKNRTSEINKRFALFCLSGAFWCGNYFLWQMARDAKTALFFSRGLMAGAIFIPICFLHFVLIFLDLVEQKRKILKFGYFIFFVFFILNFTPYFVKEVTPELFFPFWPKAGIAFGPFLIIWLWYWFYASILLFKAHRQSIGSKRNQIKYVLVGVLLGYIGGSTNYFLWYGIPVPPYGNFIMPLYVGIIAYAIVKHQLMDIRVVIKRAFFYSLGIALISGFITGITFLSSWFMQVIPGFRFWTVPLFVGIVAFFIGNLFWRKSKQVEKAYEVEKKAREELEHLSETKDQFLLATQHHLRTPLSIMKGYLSVLLAKKQELDLKTREDFLEKTLNSTNRLIKLVNEFLDISQLQVGKQPLNFQPTNIRNLIEDIFKDLQGEISAKNLKVKILPENKEDWPLIPADPEKFRIALYNIIDNAVRYTLKGEIIIQGQITKDSFQLSIQDTGIGINPEEIPDLFTRYFERGEQAQKLYTTGRGIGLFIASSIIKALQGKIWAESEGLNKGARFVIELRLSNNVSDLKV